MTVIDRVIYVLLLATLLLLAVVAHDQAKINQLGRQIDRYSEECGDRSDALDHGTTR
jgi:hypothetical protein